MVQKIVAFDVALKSTERQWVQKVPEVYTNDLNSVSLQFRITDCTDTELTGSTAIVLLKMRDGSFFQGPPVDVTRTLNVFSYTLKENEGNHDGLAEIQLIVTIDTKEFATQKYNFKVITGLDSEVVREIMIYDWSTLTAEARAYIDEFASLTEELTSMLAAANASIGAFDVALENGIVAANLAEKLEDFESINNRRLLSVEGGLADINSPNLATDIKSKTYAVGDRIQSNLYGGSVWEVKNTILIEGYPLTFEDELHLQVSLTGGGTGYAECRIDSIKSYLESVQTKKYVETFAKLKRRQASTLVCHGDSITYGQGGTNVMNGVATGFGDGSTYNANNQVDSPYPEVLQGKLNEVYGAGVASVINRGYPGDTVGAMYLRQRNFSGQTMSTINIGTNDMLSATTNGTLPDGILTADRKLTNFTDAYKKFIAREILRGSAVVLINPNSWLVGTDDAQGKAIQYYRNAIKSLGDELNLLVVDFEEFVGGYPIDIYMNGVHPKQVGYTLLGTRLASIFIGNGYKVTDRISGERHIFGRLYAENIVFGGLNGESKALRESTSSFASYSKDVLGTKLDYDFSLPSGATAYYSFYLEKDTLYFAPIFQLAAAGTFTYDLNFNHAQKEVKLDVKPYQVMNDRTTPVSSVVVSQNTAAGYNSFDDYPDNLIIVGKGWHTIKLSATAFSIIHGFRFFDSAETLKLNWYKKPGQITDYVIDKNINFNNYCKLRFIGKSLYDMSVKMFINDDTTETNYYNLDESTPTVINNDSMMLRSLEFEYGYNNIIDVDLYQISTTQLMAKIKVVMMASDNSACIIKNKIWKYNALSGAVNKITIKGGSEFTSDSLIMLVSL